MGIRLFFHMLGRVIKVIRDPDALKVTWKDLEGCPQIFQDGFGYYHCPAILDKCMASLGCAIELPHPDHPEEKSHAIIVDDHFQNLSENAQRFVIAHEAGHIHHEHFKRQLTDNRERARLIKEGDVYLPEIEADAFAMGILGYWNSVWALEELSRYIKCTSGNKKSLTTRELDFRIRALKK
ncbi:MAG: hypothetical protein FWF59_00645 [Turicibacter sp.]|nr:hypothetical protein [Turicibacter sp.]